MVNQKTCTTKDIDLRDYIYEDKIGTFSDELKEYFTDELNGGLEAKLE